MTAATTSDTVVELLGVRRRYRFGESVVNALDGIELKIARGSFVGVIGRSGSGKSTLLNILGGLDQPSDGQVLVDGQPLRGRGSDDMASYRREVIGFIFQSFNLIAHLTALDNVALPLALKGTGYFDRKKRARELLEKVGLGDRVDHRPPELSGGERQRVAIARALVNEPRLLLADEPTGNLDSKTAEEIMGMLRDLHEQEGRTIVLVTHDADRAERFCERIVVLEDGRVREDRAAHRLGGGAAEGQGAAEATPEEAAAAPEADADAPPAQAGDGEAS